MEDISQSGTHDQEQFMCWSKLAVLVPIIFVLVMVFGFTATYIVAVTNDHVRSVFPYISDTGNFHPESSLFTLVCCIAAFFGFLMFFIHYKHIQVIVENKSFQRCNCVAFYLSLLSAVGLLLIASFQDGANLSGLHYFGAILLFGLGTVYCFIVTIIGWHVAIKSDDQCLKFISVFRFAMCVLMLVGCITAATATSIATNKFDDFDHTRNITTNRFKWNPNDGGFKVHIVATGAEWFVALVSVIFFLTFVRSFYEIEVEAMTIKLKKRHGYSRIGSS